MGLGIGQQTLAAVGTDAGTSQTVSIDVVSSTLTPGIGWMWGIVDGGLFFGIDFGYQSPSSPRTTIITSLPSSNQAYIDAQSQATTLGSTAFPTLTFLRLGYLF